MCPKPFSWAKNKRKLFSDGKSRGPLLAGAALNLHCLQKLEGCCLPLALPFFFFCLKMNELLAKFKDLKSLHLLRKDKTFKKGHLGIKRGLIRKKEGTPYYVQ